MLWRYIPPIETSGKVQMAIDRWLLQQHRQNDHPPTLRFYTWSPPAISLGYHQKEYPEFWQNLSWQGQKIDLVVRPTGGRAVLHQGDLTYMVVTSNFAATRKANYQTICEFLVRGWQSLGVQLSYGKGSRGYIGNSSCFATVTDADLITANGDKLIGSAQLRQGKALLQHGSMLLKPTPELFELVFGKSASSLPPPTHFSPDSIIQALSQAAVTFFAIDLVEEPLTLVEWQDIFTYSGLGTY